MKERLRHFRNAAAYTGWCGNYHFFSFERNYYHSCVAASLGPFIMTLIRLINSKDLNNVEINALAFVATSLLAMHFHSSFGISTERSFLYAGMLLAIAAELGAYCCPNPMIVNRPAN